MSNKSIKTNTKSQLTDRKKNIISGVLISFLLIITPFLFYVYKYAPADTNQWDTIFGTITASGFNNVQSFTHALFTKITFVLLTTIWFLTSQNWWKYAILVPLTMFLFQLIGVTNQELQYIDELDFWYSLPFIIPILFFLVYISYQISKRSTIAKELKRDLDAEIKKIWSDEL